MPNPSKGEKKDDFIPRCMGNKKMNSEFPDQKQRAAVCFSYWDRKDESTDTKMSFKDFLMEKAK